MTADDLLTARLECERFLRRTETVLSAVEMARKNEPYPWPHGSISLVHRASMDVSEAMVRLRKQKR